LRQKFGIVEAAASQARGRTESSESQGWRRLQFWKKRSG
jgi:hypothetical protein